MFVLPTRVSTSDKLSAPYHRKMSLTCELGLNINKFAMTIGALWPPRVLLLFLELTCVAECIYDGYSRNTDLRRGEICEIQFIPIPTAVETNSSITVHQ